MNRAYYNENNAFAAQWLRNLIVAGHIAAGDVDERSVIDVCASDLIKYDQCHFFAGIGGWSYALRLAGWPNDRPVWTGSCPCQPFSCAGKQKGFADERHLWPNFFRLIAKCRPAAVFGEQVSRRGGLEWLVAVRSDLEGIGYAVGAADLPACSVGAPHIRRRLFWVADAECSGSRAWRPSEACVLPAVKFDRHGTIGGAVAHSLGPRLEERQEQSTRQECEAAERSGDVGELGDAGRERWRQIGDDSGGGSERSSAQGTGERSLHECDGNPWANLEWFPCIDGKWRPTKPGLFPLAHGVPGRVGKLRAAGNAIVPQVAAEFIGAFMECQP